MRQDRKALSMMDIPDLPVEAFRHVGDRKIKLHGGGNPISDLIEGVGDIISDVGSAVDDFVHDVIPGGWAGVAAIGLLAAGIYDPELLALAEEGALTTAELEAAGYDAMAVAEGVSSVAPEVVATTEAAVASGVSPELIAMANATADPIAALNAAAGWTASDAGYLMSIGYAGPIVDPVSGAAVDVNTAAKAQSMGWESAAGSGVPDAAYVDANGTYFNAAGEAVKYGDFSGQVVSSVPTTQGGVSGVQVTDSLGNTWFEPAPGALNPAPVFEAPVVPESTLPQLAGNQSVVAGTEIGQQIPGAYSVDSAGVYYDVNGQVVATTQANGGVVATNGLQLIDAPIAAAPANTIPVTLSDGSVGAFDPATGTVYNSAGAVDTAATETMQTAGAGFGEGTQVAEAAKDTAVATDVAAETPFRVEVTGAAGTAETPSYAITESMTPGSQLATQAEIDAGTATWNPAANAWEVTAAPVELSPVVPTEVTTGGMGAGVGEGVGAGVVNPSTGLLETVTPGVNGVASVVLTPAEIAAGGLTAAETAALGAGGLAATSALGGGGAAGAGATGAVGAGPAVTGPVVPGTSAPATVITPSGDVVATTTTPPVTPVEPPLSPVQTEVIPPGSSTVASVTAPPAGITTAAEAAAAGFDAATVAKWVAAGLVAKALLTPPPVATPAGYGPLNTHYPFGTAEKMVNPGLNPGWITAQPFYNTTSPVQSQYYWGNHPYAETPADLAKYNNIPYAPATPWGLQQPQAPFDVNTYIRQTMTPQQQAALAGSAPQYYGPIAPATPVVGSKV